MKIARNKIYLVLRSLTGKLPMNESRPTGRKILEIGKVLAEMRREKEQLDGAILSLERLAAGKQKGRGRPPAWMALA